MGVQDIELGPSNFDTVIFSPQVNFSAPRHFQFQKKVLCSPPYCVCEKRRASEKEKESQKDRQTIEGTKGERQQTDRQIDIAFT